jgi:O-antigen/teichoic acid export membrane protein
MDQETIDMLNKSIKRTKIYIRFIISGVMLIILGIFISKFFQKYNDFGRYVSFIGVATYIMSFIFALTDQGNRLCKQILADIKISNNIE